jgi:hypothetical protein
MTRPMFALFWKSAFAHLTVTQVPHQGASSELQSVSLVAGRLMKLQRADPPLLDFNDLQLLQFLLDALPQPTVSENIFTTEKPLY